MLCRQNSLNIAYTQLSDKLYTCFFYKNYTLVGETERKEQPADRPTNAYGDAFLAANSVVILQILFTMHLLMSEGCTANSYHQALHASSSILY